MNFLGQLKPEQIARKLLVDDSFKQSKRELQLVVVLDQEIVGELQVCKPKYRKVRARIKPD